VRQYNLRELIKSTIRDFVQVVFYMEVHINLMQASHERCAIKGNSRVVILREMRRIMGQA
jgi:hypothetical protein